MSFPHFDGSISSVKDGRTKVRSIQDRLLEYLVALKFEVLWQKVFFARHWEAMLEQSLIWKYSFCLHVFTRCCPATILGDPGAVSRVRRKGGTKVFKYWRKSPWVPTLTELFPNIQADAGSWLGTKNDLYYCAQSANSFSWVLFVSSYTTAIVSITACLAHAPKKCTQSGNFQFDIKSPSDFKILSARKLKTLFQKYKLELTTGIHACIGHVLRKY